MPVVDEPGTFAVRGEVIDVFAPLAPHPVRIPQVEKPKGKK